MGAESMDDERVIDYPKDKYGEEFKPGTLFVEGRPGEKIWDGEATIMIAPTGLFTGEKVEYPAFKEWIVETYMEGLVKGKDGSTGPLYISRWDGEFTGDWEDTIITGNREKMRALFEEFCLKN